MLTTFIGISQVHLEVILCSVHVVVFHSIQVVTDFEKLHALMPASVSEERLQVTEVNIVKDAAAFSYGQRILAGSHLILFFLLGRLLRFFTVGLTRFYSLRSCRFLRSTGLTIGALLHELHNDTAVSLHFSV